MNHILLLTAALAAAASAETALTIYNRDLAVVRETLPLALKAGENTITFDRATAHAQPDSVVLRDPAGKARFAILEQSYRNDPVGKWLLLHHFEGRTVDFRTVYPDGRVETFPGKIIRSGHVPGMEHGDPIIEVDGKLRFQLPGEPLFPALADSSILRPTLGWRIAADEPVSFDAQLSYLSNGFEWQADYNLVAPENSGPVTLSGWITLKNQSGTGFEQAKVKLVAGDVNIIAPSPRLAKGMMQAEAMDMAAPRVEEKAFDDFHLYTLPLPLTIRDRESKQVEFIRSPRVMARKSYVYDGAAMPGFGGGPVLHPLENREFSKDVAVRWEFRNDEESGLGRPLPAGRIRIYRTDDADGNLEFVGENQIGHTPRNEELRIHTGNAFDLVGGRRITGFQSRERENRMSESVEVKLRNRSKEPRTITVREHLWRWSNWEIQDPSMEFRKTDDRTIEFEVPVQPDEEKTITYTARYSW
jgi:hypothetical protein